jgi:hypothetical protein
MKKNRRGNICQFVPPLACFTPKTLNLFDEIRRGTTYIENHWTNFIMGLDIPDSLDIFRLLGLDSRKCA